MKKLNSLLKGALIISVGTVITKVLGALYRVPLTSIIGVEGIGIYQMVFPFYCILLTLSATGIPSALSKLIADGYNAKKVLYKSIIAFGIVGIIASLAMFLLSKPISRLQGNELSYLSYRTLAPSVFFVSVLSCYRGYFQGKMNMLPTCFSQIIEQVVKLTISLLLLHFFSFEPHIAASVCTLAVTVSEAFALAYIMICYAFHHKRADFGCDVKIKLVVKIVLPIAITSIMLPLSRAVDSFLVVRLLPFGVERSTALYGAYSGAVESLIGVPVAVCYGLAISGIPYLTKNKNSDNALSLILYTVILSGLAWLATALLAPQITGILYSRLDEQTRYTISSLLVFSGAQILLLSLLQSLSSVLIANDKAFVAPLNLLAGTIVKIVVVLITVRNAAIGIYGVAISDISCFFVAATLNLLYIIRVYKTKRVASAQARAAS